MYYIFNKSTKFVFYIIHKLINLYPVMTVSNCTQTRHISLVEILFFVLHAASYFSAGPAQTLLSIMRILQDSLLFFPHIMM